jgi:hypothetical protein
VALLKPTGGIVGMPRWPLAFAVVFSFTYQVKLARCPIRSERSCGTPLPLRAPRWYPACCVSILW